jgi:SAM-dependent methyltransferase
MTELITEYHPKAPALRARMDAFYSNFSGYNAFQAPNHVDHFWPLLLSWLNSATGKLTRPLRVLEFGAGRTGFPGYLKTHGLRERVHLTLHDVTRTNAEWLRGMGDEIQIGTVPKITGTFDLIFSTFVLEHMTDPDVSLRHLWSILSPEGAIFLISPCYDFPFYLPPACDHLRPWTRRGLGLCLIGWRLRTILTRRPAFLLLNDLAMFHLPWEQDRDAVHLASAWDVKTLFRQMGGRVTPLRSIWRGGYKDWIVKRKLQLCVRIDHGD